jgi:hypothetical protein
MKALAFTPPGNGSTCGAAANPATALERERGRGAEQAARVQVAKAKTSCTTWIARKPIVIALC